ncbi:MAG TPA: isovaleryl-CoA dehydrogenase [Burkholderiaceae bacterium]|nr:isovaleryl-CoA dehydrogenase [Burkholderiaceae bacterium]
MEWSTHQVTNQVPDLVGYNLFDADVALNDAVRREGAAAFEQNLRDYGSRLGGVEVAELALRANQDRPKLETFDRLGHRIDQVRFDPAWHQLMGMAFEQGMHVGVVTGSEGFQAGWPAARAALYLLHGQIEAGTLCPLTMTAAAAPALRDEPWFHDLAPHLYSRRYDPRDMPVPEKAGVTIGMGMTEKQGGSDLRANATQAFPLEQGAERGAAFRLVGHKWFFSSPTSDAHLVLAHCGGALSCFFVPRWTPDGTRNAVRIQRLKNKMGNASNASAEVEFQDAFGILVGDPGRGIPILAEMATRTRLDCVLGSTALLRQALVQALHHARTRQAFGRKLADHGLMRQVLADLALESEAATVLAMRLAGALEKRGSSAEERVWVRILTPAAKFWICKRAIQAVAECMEVWGGNGYIEDGPMPRLYRETPVNSIWEGSGNVMCLDVLRALNHDADAGRAFADTLVRDASVDRPLRARAERLVKRLRTPGANPQPWARHISREIVLLSQAVLLRKHAPAPVADAFMQTRIHSEADGVFGSGMPVGAAETLLARSWPV